MLPNDQGRSNGDGLPISTIYDDRENLERLLKSGRFTIRKFNGGWGLHDQRGNRCAGFFSKPLEQRLIAEGKIDGLSEFHQAAE
jgi:hypothetical protein